MCFVNFIPQKDGEVATLDAPVMCAKCGHCIAACPTDAIDHPNVALSDSDPLDESARPSYDQLMSFLKMRRSRREYVDKDVPREVIDKLLAAAVQAPNGINRGNVRYTVITDRQILDEIAGRITRRIADIANMMRKPVGRFFFKLFNPNMYRELEMFLPLMDHIGGSDEINLVTYNAPCAILVHTTKEDMCGAEDSVYAASLIQYAAESLGLGTCCVGFITAAVNMDKALKMLVRLPHGHKVQTCLIVGYPEFRYDRSAPKSGPRVEYI